MVYYVYVLQSATSKQWYIGMTSDLRKRLSEHNSGMFTSWTKGRGPFSVIYFEGCSNKGDARSRELYLKSGMGRRYLKNRIRRFLALTG